jgi:phospholipid/cholesterol/gamma-HCH transport system substrate-binding protein
MTKQTTNNLKLGTFVAVGTVVLVLALYFIGSKRNVFSSTFPLRGAFTNVSGLMVGNNVRMSGIDVGTVKHIVIENDSTVTVYMDVQKKVRPFIKKNSTVSIGTDGLVGSKLVNIIASDDPAPQVEDNDMLASTKSVETEEMLRTLNTTNANLAAITTDLRNITGRIRGGNGIMKIFDDSETVYNLQRTFTEFREVAENSRRITENVNKMVVDLKSSNGVVGTLLSDTVTAMKFKNVVSNLDRLSDSLTLVSHQLNNFSESLNDPNGSIHVLTKDTATANNIRGTVSNLKTTSELLNEDLKALQRNFLFRKYFKEKSKAKKP